MSKIDSQVLTESTIPTDNLAEIHSIQSLSIKKGCHFPQSVTISNAQSPEKQQNALKIPNISAKTTTQKPNFNQLINIDFQVPSAHLLRYQLH